MAITIRVLAGSSDAIAHNISGIKTRQLRRLLINMGLDYRVMEGHGIVPSSTSASARSSVLTKTSASALIGSDLGTPSLFSIVGLLHSLLCSHLLLQALPILPLSNQTHPKLTIVLDLDDTLLYKPLVSSSDGVNSYASINR